ncbi:MAG: zinc metallopeptidase [Bacteroidales bacterium]|nr:zinc metallopeptidase [Bacteroidales bacterium]
MQLYWIIFIGTALLSYIVQASLQSKYNKYSKIRIDGYLTGKDVAERMLREHGITDVRVTCIAGTLTDNYNPTNKTLNLSDGVYNSCSVMAAAVAAHECGHAVQHACGYIPVKVRSALVPVVSISSRLVTWVLLAGMLLINVFPHLMLAGITLFAMTTLFSLVTLPVEINASSRALEWLNNTGITNYSNHEYAVSALKSAAYTYVVAALSSLATLLYYVMIFLGGRRR